MPRCLVLTLGCLATGPCGTSKGHTIWRISLRQWFFTLLHSGSLFFRAPSYLGAGVSAWNPEYWTKQRLNPLVSPCNPFFSSVRRAFNWKAPHSSAPLVFSFDFFFLPKLNFKMAQSASDASWPAGIPVIHLHPTDLPSDELPEEAKGWLLFVKVGSPWNALV
jgi:hypothetical protein